MEVLVKADWMNKPKEEMSEEERKQVKEFEKRVAQHKEEQEKYRKALETELRKLQSSVSEICQLFDEKLKDFFLTKLASDQNIFQNELKMIKLGQAIIFSEDDEVRELSVVNRLEELKSEKAACAAEIPEIKKDLEKCREEYDSAVKKDREVERQFKKEFHQFDFYFDNLIKLFKRRELTKVCTYDDQKVLSNRLVKTNEAEETPKQVENGRDPFAEHQRALTVVEDVIPQLSKEVDCPEGLGEDSWSKLVEYRDRKINTESDVKATQKKFNEMQTLVQSVLDESERIKNETDRVSNDLAEFLEYKFLSTYNVESLFQLKQGQVEVHQAPVVTDYSDTVLLHRIVVEKLNENILALGGSKVDALQEMKDYRKGIHALEWYGN